jgi:alanyl-tRNA synthetase
MTPKLYYQNPYLKEFSGTVLHCLQRSGKTAVILDQTAFYPTSGGQPHDTGTLGPARVVDVVEENDGSVLHILDREIPLGKVDGIVDWERRFDHMQQHTGQHILSQAFLKSAGAATISFHMGQETSTIDVEIAQPSMLQMEEAQKLATTVAFEDRPVCLHFVNREDLHSFGVRKESQREGEIRIVDVEGFDRSPCGGTHVRRTGEIGMIFILGFERYKGGTRVEFVAGYRALISFVKNSDLVRKLGKIYSAAIDNLPAISERLLQEKSDLLRENERLRGQVLEMETAELIVNAKMTGPYCVIRKIFPQRNLESLKVLAQKLTSRPGVVTILGNVSQLVAARSKDVGGDCNRGIKKITANFGGKGGGQPELAQAGGLPADSLAESMSFLEEFLLGNQ